VKEFSFRAMTLDKDRPKATRGQKVKAATKFKRPAAAEREYERQLRSVAKQVGHLIKLYQDGARMLPGFDKAIAGYVEALAPWASRVAERMLEAVGRTNYRQWMASSRAIGRELKADVNVMEARLIQQEQVVLIQSLPTEAAARAQKLAFDAAIGGRRIDEIEAEIKRSGEVTAARATLIARTEVAKANSTITETRAKSVGSTQYIWRTAEDAAVRESHAEMEGVVVDWDNPPTLSDGTTTHAGMIYNCRCYAEPIIE